MRAILLVFALGAGCGPRADLPEVAASTTVGVPGAPAQARAAYLRALWHEARGETASAAAALERARAFDPDSVELREAQARLEAASEAHPSPDP